MSLQHADLLIPRVIGCVWLASTCWCQCTHMLYDGNTVRLLMSGRWGYELWIDLKMVEIGTCVEGQ